MNITTRLLSFAIIISLLLVTGCVEQTPEETVEVDWKNVELTDINTGETFRISDFEGQPILIESFAVWCPTCLEQQKQVKEFKDSEGDTVIHISLDTDPNEDEEKVREHLERNEFDWYFAVPPKNFTQSLIDEFGLAIVNAPDAPVVLICEDQSARMLPRGLKSTQELIEEVEKGC